MKRLIGLCGAVMVMMAGTACQDMRTYDEADRIGPEITKVDVKQSAILEHFCANLANDPPNDCWSGNGSERERGEVAWINRFRKRMGFGCAFPHDTIQAAARNHATYFRHHIDQENWSCVGTGHSEKAGCALFTGVTRDDRIVAAGGFPPDTVPNSSLEVISDSVPPQAPQENICALFLDAPFHHGRFIKSEFNRIGAGYNESRGILTHGAYVVDWAEMIGAAKLPGYWPAPGSGMNRRTMDAADETPTPPNCEAGWPNCGAVVSLRMPNGTVRGATLCEKNLFPPHNCWDVPVLGLFNSNFPTRVAADTGMIYAQNKLKASTVYRVQWFVNVCGRTTPEGFPIPCRDEFPWWEFATGDGPY